MRDDHKPRPGEFADAMAKAYALGGLCAMVFFVFLLVVRCVG